MDVHSGIQTLSSANISVKSCIVINKQKSPIIVLN